MSPRANQLTGSEWLKNSFSIWRGQVKDRDSGDHPAPFPVGLASKLIECYAADPSGTVLDPFAGSGSTLLAALRSGMYAIGIDLNPEYRQVFLKRLSLFDSLENGWKYETHDSRSLNEIVKPNSVEICITSPPYWDILNRRRSADGKESRSYSLSGGDIGNIGDYNEFLSALGAVAQQVEASLRPRGYFVLNVMDIRKGSIFYPLHVDAMRRIRELTSLTLEDIIIWDRQADYSNMKPLGYPNKFIVNKVHEYLLVFRKGVVKSGEETRTDG